MNKSLELIHKEEWDISGPILTSFQTCPPPSFTDNNTNVSFNVFRNINSKKRKQKLIIGKTSKFVYQGANFGHQSNTFDLSNYAIGIYDKNMKKVELTNLNEVYLMQQTTRNLRENIHENKNEDISYMDKRKNLAEMFGTKKSKRMVKTYEENRTDMQVISGVTSLKNILEEKVQDSIQQKELSKTSKITNDPGIVETRKLILPPYNISADCANDIYVPSSFIPDEVLTALNRKADNLIQEMEHSNNRMELIGSYGMNEFITNRLIHLNKPYDNEKITYLYYLEYLLLLYKIKFPYRKLKNDLVQKLKTSHLMIDHLLNLFSETLHSSNGKISYTQPKILKDKLSSYIIVMALIIDDFQLDVNDLGKQLKRNLNSLVIYCKQVGCTIDISKDNRVRDIVSSKNVKARLTAPLMFPKVYKRS